MKSRVAFRSFVSLGALAAVSAAASSNSYAADLSKFSPDLAETLSVTLRSGYRTSTAGYSGSSARGALSQTQPTLRVIVRTNRPTWDVRTRRGIRAQVSRVGRTFSHVSVLVVEATSEQLLALSDDPSVVSLSPDRAVSSSSELDINPRAVGAHVAGQQAVGSLNSGALLQGSGIGVAVIDSGVAPVADLEGRIVGFQDFVNGQAAPYDDFGHGTHVAGIVAGNGAASTGEAAVRTYRGIAPAANVVGLKVLDNQGAGTISNVIAALDWCIAHKTEYNLRVINLSLAAGVFESYKTDPLCQAAERAVDAGIVVVASVGNWGGIYGSVAAPANDPTVIAVGASNSRGTAGRSDDRITSFTGRGPSRFDHMVKPDLLAPGNNIVSLRAPGSLIDTEFPETVVATSDYLDQSVASNASSYAVLSGTSMAAPAVAGAAALLLQTNPSLTPNAVKAALMFSAQLLHGYDPVLQRTAVYDPLAQGAGLLNIPGAVEMASRMKRRGLLGQPSLTTSIEGSSFTWMGAALPDLLNRPGGVSPLSLTMGQAPAWNGTALWGDGSSAVQDWSDELVWGSSLVWGGSCGDGGVGTGKAFLIPDQADLLWGAGDLQAASWGGDTSDIRPDNLVFGGEASTGVSSNSVSPSSLVWGGSCGDGGDPKKLLKADDSTGP